MSLDIREFSYAYPGSDHVVLKNVNMAVGPGECHCITGRTGSGKSTLLLAIKGLLPKGIQYGSISTLYPDSAGKGYVGLVLQNPETQLLGTTVGSETAFGLENLCVPPMEMEKRVKEALSAVGLEKPLDFPVKKLSMGQKYRLVMAAAMVMAPSLLLLDEPGAQLDESGISKLKKIILFLKKRGVGVVICEHHPHYFRDLVDAYWEIDPDGCLNRLPSDISIGPCISSPAEKRSREKGEEIIGANNIEYLGNGFGSRPSPASFSISNGQRVGIYGKNGAGKTTLLRCMTGFIPPSRGSIRIFGSPPSPRTLRGVMGCLFQNPQKQLFENTVCDEIAFPLKRMGFSGREVKEKVGSLMDRMSIAPLSKRSPHKLSFGQKHLVALASALIFSPRILMLDDPFAGLDHHWQGKMMSVFLDDSETNDMTLIWTGHRQDELFPYADTIMDVKGGEIGLRS